MEDYDLVLGQLVRSVAGRDKGRFFYIIERIDRELVKVCDGDVRKVDKAKQKKCKHLKKTNHVNYELKERLEAGQKVSNAEIRRYLEDSKTFVQR